MAQAHALILGQTLSGKTTLAKKLAANYQARGIKVIVLDPMNDAEWPNDFKTRDPDEFLAVLWDSEGCAFFIDEAGKSVGRFDDMMIETATEGRHFGHRGHYISQRGAQIAFTVRAQCTELFLFNTNLDDCKIHSKEWGEPLLLQGNVLPQFHYIYKSRFQSARQLILEE